jgi:hypothetical protein
MDEPQSARHERRRPGRELAALIVFLLLSVTLNAEHLTRSTGAVKKVGELAHQLKLDRGRAALETFIDNNLGRGRPLVVAGTGPRVALLGNSLMENLAPPLLETLRTRWGAQVSVDTALGTVLDDTLLIDWPAEIVRAAASNDIVYVLVSPDDDLTANEHVWTARNTELVSSIAEQLGPDDGTVIWLTSPYQQNQSEQRRAAWVKALNDGGGGQITVVPTEDLIDGGQHTYTRTVETGGRTVVVRIDDGIHLTEQGASIVADGVIERTAAILDTFI